jgi:hypothetical protein
VVKEKADNVVEAALVPKILASIISEVASSVKKTRQEPDLESNRIGVTGIEKGVSSTTVMGPSSEQDSRVEKSFWLFRT